MERGPKYAVCPSEKHGGIKMKRKRRIIILILFPIIGPLFWLGWTLRSIGETMKEEVLKQ